MTIKKKLKKINKYNLNNNNKLLIIIKMDFKKLKKRNII